MQASMEMSHIFCRAIMGERADISNHWRLTNIQFMQSIFNALSPSVSYIKSSPSELWLFTSRYFWRVLLEFPATKNAETNGSDVDLLDAFYFYPWSLNSNLYMQPPHCAETRETEIGNVSGILSQVPRDLTTSRENKRSLTSESCCRPCHLAALSLTPSSSLDSRWKQGWLREVTRCGSNRGMR